MALYSYRCEACGHVEDFEIPMADPKTARACSSGECAGMMRRTFAAAALTWRDAQGHEVRPPSKPWDWEDGRAVEIPEFKRRNPSAGDVGSRPRG